MKITSFTSTTSVPGIGQAVRVFANGPGDLGSIPGRFIPKTIKMVLDASLLNTQHYRVRIKGKVEQSMKGVAPSPTPCCSKLSKRKLSCHPRLWSPTLLFTYFHNSPSSSELNSELFFFRQQSSMPK